MSPQLVIKKVLGEALWGLLFFFVGVGKEQGGGTPKLLEGEVVLKPFSEGWVCQWRD